MIPEIGHFALILALVVSIVQGFMPMYGSLTGNNALIALAKPSARLVWGLLALSFLCLAYAHITDDFSVKYVASTSNLSLPMVYKITGIWGAHEGSLLLWALILASWGLATSIFSRSIPPVMLSRVLSVMGLIATGFLLFLLITSNPFERLAFPPGDGRSLNPLLQDFGLVIHPPMLYMGYVGCAVAFAFSIAALIAGQLDAAWTRWVRPWANIAWVFLTIGIALGSWWAYYELGWGGWWFWDPVENASFIPWLSATALMHSLVVTEKRGLFKSWTVLLAIFTFSLSLLGTFLVRSGVLTSVHAFANDPERGLFILIFLLVVVGSSLTLYAVRAPKLKSHTQFDFLSRETGLLTNNILLVVMAAAVLLGTLFPLISEALGMGKVSVGPPYFNAIMVPLAVVLSVVMGFGLLMRWKRDSLSRMKELLLIPLIAALVFAILLPLLFAPSFSGLTLLGLMMASWIAFTALMWIISQQRSLFKLPASSVGAMLGHLGLAVTFVGITLVSVYTIEKDIRINPNETYAIGEYGYRFQGVEQHRVDNYIAYRGTVDIYQYGDKITTLYPEKRIYDVQTMPMTEAGIDGGFFRDLFVALGEPLGKEGAWSLRLQYKPFIRWIWLGAILMALGGLLAAFDKRYRKLQTKKANINVATPQEAV